MNSTQRVASRYLMAGRMKDLMMDLEDKEIREFDELYDYTQLESTLDRWRKAHSILGAMSYAPMRDKAKKAVIIQAKRALENRNGVDPVIALDAATRKKIRSIAYRSSRTWESAYRREFGGVPATLKIKDEISRLFKADGEK